MSLLLLGVGRGVSAAAVAAALAVTNPAVYGGTPGYGSNNQTLTAKPVGTGTTYIVVRREGNNTVTGVTVGGVSATSVAFTGNPDANYTVWKIATTAGSYDVVVQCSGDTKFYTVSMFTVENANSTPVSVARFDEGYNNTGSNHVSSSVTVAAGQLGVSVLALYGGTSVNATWSAPLTEVASGTSGILSGEALSSEIATFTATASPTWNIGSSSPSSVINFVFQP